MFLGIIQARTYQIGHTQVPRCGRNIHRCHHVGCIKRRRSNFPILISTGNRGRPALRETLCCKSLFKLGKRCICGQSGYGVAAQSASFELYRFFEFATCNLYLSLMYTWLEGLKYNTKFATLFGQCTCYSKDRLGGIRLL